MSISDSRALEGDYRSLIPIVDAAPLAMIGVDRTGRIALANHYADQLFAYPVGTLVGESLERLSTAAWHAVDEAFLAPATSDPQPFKVAPQSVIGLSKDGTEISIELGLSRIATSTGTIVLAMLVNIADNRRSELRLRAVIDASPNALVLIDATGNITLVNSQAERLFGYRREELFGRPVEQLVPRRFRNLHVGQRNVFLRTPTTRSMGAGRDLYGLRKDGREIPIEIGLNPLELSYGRFVLAAIIDISERKRAERLRLQSADFGQHALAAADVAQLQRQAVELIADALGAPFVRLGELDTAQTTITFRASFGFPDRYAENHVLPVAESLQASESIRTGRPIFLENITEDSPILPSRETRSLGIVASAAIPIRGKDAIVGLLHVGTLEARRFSQDDVAFLVGIGTILGMAIDRHRREQRINQLNLELQHRYGELESFSYSVAHDLRAPLRAVAGFASALEEDYGESLDDEARRFMHLIMNGAAQMGGLIDALLSLARVSRQELSRSMVDLSAIASSCVTELYLGDPARHVVTSIAPGLVVSGDAALLRNLLANLLGNAWKFTRGCDTALIRFESTTIDGETVYALTDNGIGFSTQHPEELFVPFKRLHAKDFEGTGIGLATVARIVHRHGGRVWAESEPHFQTTFFFTLGDHYE